jgi:hypothetical protein
MCHAVGPVEMIIKGSRRDGCLVLYNIVSRFPEP